LCWGPSARARNADGTLSVILTPNSGVPAIVIPGGSFDAGLTQPASIALIGQTAACSMAVEYAEMPGGRIKAHCTVPLDIAPGSYVLEASTANGVDRNLRSVFVRAKYPEYYIIAQVTDSHVGLERGGRKAADVLRAVIAAVNETPAVFTLVTGDVTDDGEVAHFKEFSDLLDTALIPTFVCPGNHDRLADNYEKFFGPLAYMFWFGQDGYIVFDTKDYVTADEVRAQNGDLEIFRRAIKPARWAVGVTHRYEPEMGMHAQLALFIDDPLDHLIFGHWHRANEDKEKRVLWGTTPITVTPAALDGYFRLFDVSAKEIKGRPPQRVPGQE
jgi:predicted phosphodiesterase